MLSVVNYLKQTQFLCHHILAIHYVQIMVEGVGWGDVPYIVLETDEK